VIDAKVREAIRAVPVSANPMLDRPILLKRLLLGDVAPQVALTDTASLHIGEQSAGVVPGYDRDGELEMAVDLNLNGIAATREAASVNRYMGNVFVDAPMPTTCRFLVSAVRVTVKLEVTHGPESFLRFREPPDIAVCIDSNLSMLGPLFSLGLQRAMKVARAAFEALPARIELPR